MRNTDRIAAALVLAFGAGACGTIEPGVAVDRDVLRAERYLTGVFTSAAQAQEKSEEFLDIRLVCLPVWEDRRDGPWLYVEQAASARPDEPYRQRVYHLRRSGDLVISDVYTLPDEDAAVACWLDDEPLADVGPPDLTLRAGCSIQLVAVGEDEFQGSTVGERCPSELFGASFATSHVSLREGLVESWDRGFDADGNQVWGAETGPYRFVREAMPADLADRDDARGTADR